MRKLLSRRLVRSLVCSATLMMGWGSPASALLIDDDFSDGNSDGWVEHYSSLSDGTPPIYDATSGRFHLSSTGVVTNPFEGIAAGYLASKANPSYRNGTLRVNLILDNDSTSFVVSLRSNVSLSASEPSAGYSFAANNDADVIYLLRLGGSPDCDPTTPGLAQSCYFGSHSLGIGGIESGTEYFLEASAIEDTLTMKFWSASDPEPESPQLTALTTDHPFNLTGTGVTLGIYNTNSIYPISGSYDDVTFVPEPNTALLLGIGMMGLGMRRRRRMRRGC